MAEIEESLEQRLAQIKEEEASMKKAMENVTSFDKVIEKAEEDLKGEIKELKEALTARYNDHSVFVEEYKKLSEIQKELYSSVIAEEADVEKLQGLVSDVNEQNELVKSTIEAFNESTIKVNEMKAKVFKDLKKE